MKEEVIDAWVVRTLGALAPHTTYDDDDRKDYEIVEQLWLDHRRFVVVQQQLERHSEVIRAMQYRFAHRHPIRQFFWRKPWHSTAGTGWSDGATLPVKLHNFFGWLRFAHDCQDPSVGCSCHPSYRFPDPKESPNSAR